MSVPPLDSIARAIKVIRSGGIVMVVDDAARENEGDFVCAAEKITPEIVNFMATHGRGLICVSLMEARCEALKLDMMVGNNTAVHETPFTVSVDWKGSDTTTGISAHDRSRTIQALVAPSTRAEDLGRPGHIFPLRARTEGVLRRAGHTEAAMDLARLAALYPAGVLVEIMKKDGTMARLPDLVRMSKRFDMPLISIQDLIAYRLKREQSIVEITNVDMPTAYGHFRLHAFRQTATGDKHLALVKGSFSADEEVLVRVHSACLTGDVFGSQRCDCGAQLAAALKRIETQGKGVVLYMNQEGRGIGLENKLRAYALQAHGLDTVEANVKLGFQVDARDYGIGAQILKHLGLNKIRLLTNNVRKRVGLQGYGLEVVAREPIEIAPNAHNENYLRTKRDKLGHDILKR